MVEDVSIDGNVCVGTTCSVTISKTDGTSDTYDLAVNNTDLFKELSNYNSDIKLDIYYSEKDGKKTINNYKITLKSTSEDISSITTINELREKLGLYSVGSHSESMTLKEIGSEGVGVENDVSYTYRTYTFTDSKGNDYNMTYKGEKALDVTAGQNYTVNFEVVEGSFGLEYNLNSIG